MARAPRDPGQIVREIDATIGVRNIREWANLKDALAVRFGEMCLLAALFVFALGLILTLIFALPQEDEGIYNIWLLWTCGYIIITVFAIEFLLRKFRTIRRIIELNLRRAEKMEKQIARLQKTLDSRAPLAEHPEEEKSP